MPGVKVSHGAWSTTSKAWRSMPPHVGVGGFTPTPRKLSDASSRIAAPNADGRLHYDRREAVRYQM